MTNKVCRFTDLGLIDYKECWDKQEELFKNIIEIKINNRSDSVNDPKRTPNYLIFCEHPHVFTLGKSGSEANLLVNMIELNKLKVNYYKINRGGDITYHGPGQIVVYPILDLENFNLDIKHYIYYLEEIIILTLKEYNIKGERLKGATGVWLDTDKPSKVRKICAIGVRASRYVSMHGLAFNVNTELKYFNMINPCGFTDKAVTSLEKELMTHIALEDIKGIIKSKFWTVFGFEYIDGI